MSRTGLGIGIGVAYQIGGLSPAASAIINAMTTPPTAARAALINETVARLSPVWAKMDGLFVLAAANAQAARVNWKTAAVASNNGAGTYTADRGFNSGGNTSNSIDTGYNPSVSGTQNSAHFAAWSRTSGLVAAAGIGNTNATILPRTTSDLQNCRLNGSSGLTAANTDGSGYYSVNRVGSVSLRIYKNGVQTGTSGANTSSAPDNNNYFIGVRKQGSPTAAAIEWAIVHYGSQFAPEDWPIAYDAFLYYLQQVGAA